MMFACVCMQYVSFPFWIARIGLQNDRIFFECLASSWWRHSRLERMATLLV